MLRKCVFSFLAFALFLPMTILGQTDAKLPKLNNKVVTLKNGLRVILHQDKSTPIVAVNVWYHVGSKNEVIGKTGFAHLFEHMMFQGSKNYNDDYFKPLQEAGATINGSTNSDRTNYYQVVPSNFLEMALFMEADRMGGLLEAMTQERLDNQRDVVKNERRQRVDNVPGGTAFERIGELMYPKDHPYSWTTIGSLEDLSAASMDDVKAFFRQYYVPNNASLVIAGDFDEKQALNWAEKYFGKIPAGNPITRPNPAQPKFNGEVRKSYEDNVPLPRLYMIWHTVRQGHPDEAALGILGNILSSGRGSRLQSSLLHNKQLVQTIGGGNGTREIAGAFQIQANARPGKSLEEIEKEINVELEKIKNEPPTADEINRAINVIESQTIFGMQTVLGKADQMNSYLTYEGKPDGFQEDLDKYRKVTAADIQRVAKTYLDGNRLIMSYLPKAGAGGNRFNPAANEPTSTAKKETTKVDQTANLPKPGANPKFALPPIEKAKLANGLDVWLVRQTELPIVSMNLVIKSGSTADPSGKLGIADYTADLLNKGTKTRNAVEIANQAQGIGSNVGAGAGWDSTNVSTTTLTKHLDKALELYADVVVNPTFPEAELNPIKQRAVIGLAQRKTNANAIANIAFNSVLYGKDHPYGQASSETSIKAITRDDLVKFYETYYRPNNATLIVVGDVQMSDLQPKLETAFANWKAASVPETKIPAATNVAKPGIYLVDRPGSAQSVITIGQIGVSRDNPDFVPLSVMNSILGGQFTSRVNLNLREEKGYTYGARSGFSFRRGAGPFSASADVQTAVTKESVAEFMKELNGIRGAIPVTEKELEYNKQSIIRRFPQGFETNGQISGQLSNLLIYGLPDTYFNDYIAKVNAVTVADVNRVANKYLDPSNMAIVIVGDKSVIEGKLQDLGLAINVLDTEGNTVAQTDANTTIKKGVKNDSNP
jgi:zinc protease